MEDSFGHFGWARWSAVRPGKAGGEQIVSRAGTPPIGFPWLLYAVIVQLIRRRRAPPPVHSAHLPGQLVTGTVRVTRAFVQNTRGIPDLNRFQTFLIKQWWHRSPLLQRLTEVPQHADMDGRGRGDGDG